MKNIQPNYALMNIIDKIHPDYRKVKIFEKIGSSEIQGRFIQYALKTKHITFEFKPKNDDCFWCENSSSQLKNLETKK